MPDVGLTHVALPVLALPRSLAFYTKYAGLDVVHERRDPSTGAGVAWVSDRRRPFVLVLIETGIVEDPLLPLAHLGVGCSSREEVDRHADEARADGCLVLGPHDEGPPVGYYIFVRDPDGHTLELSHGQEVGLTVDHS